jgi:hypothetical protein
LMTEVRNRLSECKETERWRTYSARNRQLSPRFFVNICFNNIFNSYFGLLFIFSSPFSSTSLTMARKIQHFMIIYFSFEIYFIVISILAKACSSSHSNNSSNSSQIFQIGILYSATLKFPMSLFKIAFFSLYQVHIPLS